MSLKTTALLLNDRQSSVVAHSLCCLVLNGNSCPLARIRITVNVTAESELGQICELF